MPGHNQFLAANENYRHTSRYTFRGQFNTGDEWTEIADNRSEAEYVVNKILNNPTIAGWYVVNQLGQLLWSDDQGFSGVDVPNYFYQLLPER